MTEWTTLPSGATWHGTPEELVAFLDAIYNTCREHGLEDHKGWSPTWRLGMEGHCGEMKEGVCKLCAMMGDQVALDHIVFGRRIAAQLIREEFNEAGNLD